MDLSKIFDTLKHNFFITKLEAYGFDTKSLCYIKRYLDNSKQRARFTIGVKNMRGGSSKFDGRGLS